MTKLVRPYSNPVRALFALAAVAVPLLAACSEDTPAATTDGADGGPPQTSSPSVPSTCTDGARGGSETDVDCGGTCSKCGDGKACGGGSDCASGVCKDKLCAAPACSDGVLNGQEADKDCGGSCPACGDGKTCNVATDCASDNCGANHTCLPITCTDGKKNGTETDTDCGGSCGKCADTKACSKADDCTSGVCDAATTKCAAPSCTDHVKNGNETDEDCGGSCATKCDASAKCGTNADCSSGVCDPTAKLCSAPGCDDGVKNGNESDKDCGGGCATKCADNLACGNAGDCASSVCSGNVCKAPACNDGVKNGSETDKDCGRTCPTKCADNLACGDASDCASGVCSGNVCKAPACDDGVKNGSESDKDCGGGCTTKCGDAKACKANTDCASGSCQNGACVTLASCAAIHDLDATLPDGLYDLLGDGAIHAHYCDMTGGGWTLVLKADGAKTTFTYSSALWSNTTTLGTPNLDKTEAKLPAFNNMPFDQVRVDLETGGTTAALILPVSGSSLRGLFANGSTVTSVGRNAWKGLILGSSLQANCNREGLNVIPAGSGYAQVRIGIVGNQETDCTSPDSWIGVGGYGDPCGGHPDYTSVGNVAGCDPDNGSKLIRSFGSVYVH